MGRNDITDPISLFGVAFPALELLWSISNLSSGGRIRLAGFRDSSVARRASRVGLLGPSVLCSLKLISGIGSH